MSRLLILFIFTLIMGCTNDPKERGFHIFPDMVYSVPFQPYSENPLTSDGKTMLPQVKGTIAKDSTYYSYGMTDGDRIRASRELKNPIPQNTETLLRGKEVYQETCLICHGEAGKGDGPIIPKFPNPPSFSSKQIKTLTDGEIYHIITRGSGLMPPHALQITPDDRWKLVHYVNQLRGDIRNE